MNAAETYVVIGSNSFSGSDFIDLLLDDPKKKVIGISRSPEKSSLFLPYKAKKSPNFKFYQLDLNKDKAKIILLLDEVQPGYIVNFAAQSEVAPSWANPGQWFQTNAVAITELADALNKRKYLKRYLHISSPEVYGTCEGVVKEDAPFNPSTLYAASKAAGDMSLFTYVKNFNFPLVMIRSTNVYGAHQQLFKIIPRSVIYLKLGKTIELHGGGGAIKSFIHIRDISRGELAALEKGRTGEIYHLSPDKGIAVRDVVRVICDKMGVAFEKATRAVSERLGQDKAYVIDSSKARGELDWRPSISLEEGISGVADWVEKYWQEIQKTTVSVRSQTIEDLTKKQTNNYIMKSAILEKMFMDLPTAKNRHAPDSKLYGLLKQVAHKEVQACFLAWMGEPRELAPFGHIIFPYHKMGAIDSLDLFGIDELIIFSFYWANRKRYHRVLDIGANIGLHSILLSKCGYEVRCFEPDPETFKVLQRNLKLNNCLSVTPFNAAVSSKSGEMEFVRVLGNTTGSHLAGSKKTPYGELDKFPVKVEGIGQIIDWADLIKLDAEGHEKEIIMATKREQWIKTDAIIEVENRDNAAALFEHFNKIGINMFAQKINWNKVDKIEDVPAGYRNGSLFVTLKVRCLGE